MTFKETLIAKGYEAAHLDDVVHDAASSLASNANNGGMKEQIEFLITTCGWSEEDILRALDQG